MLRAARAVGAPPVAIELRKRIPAGGGTGRRIVERGGDAARARLRRSRVDRALSRLRRPVLSHRRHGVRDRTRRGAHAAGAAVGDPAAAAASRGARTDEGRVRARHALLAAARHRRLPRLRELHERFRRAGVRDAPALARAQGAAAARGRDVGGDERKRLDDRRCVRRCWLHATTQRRRSATFAPNAARRLRAGFSPPLPGRRAEAAPYVSNAHRIERRRGESWIERNTRRGCS